MQNPHFKHPETSQIVAIAKTIEARPINIHFRINILALRGFVWVVLGRGGSIFRNLGGPRMGFERIRKTVM